MPAHNKQDLFVVTRNTNRNEVHYAIETTGDSPLPAGKAPVSVYWLMLEKGPGVTEPITIFEQMAFGIASQHVEGERITLKLAALPDRAITIARTENAEKPYRAYCTIDGAEAELTDFYAHAEATFLLPKVKYIEIHGLRAGEKVTERINK